MSRTFDILSNDTVGVVFDNLCFQSTVTVKGDRALWPQQSVLLRGTLVVSFTLMHNVCVLREHVLCRSNNIGRIYNRHPTRTEPWARL